MGTWDDKDRLENDVPSAVRTDVSSPSRRESVLVLLGFTSDLQGPICAGLLFEGYAGLHFT
jgi:hypothetical protein